MQLDGKSLHYTVTVGALPVRDSGGKVAGEVVVTAYTVEGANRPVYLRLQRSPRRIFCLPQLSELSALSTPGRVSVHEFPGGHMFYTRAESRIALREDVGDMYSKH